MIWLIEMNLTEIKLRNIQFKHLEIRLYRD